MVSMRKGYVLVSTSRGDDLIHSKDTPVAFSFSKPKLELFKSLREGERRRWEHQLPYEYECVVIDHETIREIEIIE